MVNEVSEYSGWVVDSSDDVSCRGAADTSGGNTAMMPSKYCKTDDV